MKQLVYATYLSIALSASVSASAGSVVFDNTANGGSPGIITNMNTDYDSGCTKTQATANNTCNSFAVSPSAIQVMQRDQATNGLVAEVGVDNQTNSYDNGSDETKRLRYFDGDKQLFDLDHFRAAATWISGQVKDNPALNGVSGNITWEQFIDNVANHRTMYGIVRVEVPTVVIGSGKNTHHKQSPNVRGFCGRSNSNSNSNSNNGCNRCGPERNGATTIAAGQTVCDTPIPQDAAIDVRGSLMFDFVDCVSSRTVTEDELPESVNELSFKIAVPVNINPATTTDALAAHVDSVASLSITKTCGTSPPCQIPINDAIPFTSVPEQSKEAYKYRTGAADLLTETEFGNLNKADQYHLLMPSGYVDGWHTAFDMLSITNAEWKRLGFGTAQNSGSISLDDIRSNDFEDIPAYVYAGGLVEMHGDINISGLLYVPQAIDIEQRGTNGPAKQYIMGAVVVRDGFYMDANDSGGITLISNDPDSYSQIKVATRSIAGAFQAYDRSAGGTGNNAAGLAAAAPGPQWVEIRAR